jgi:hypothetical protein
MSINFCTLTNSSVDTFCGNRRQIVLDNLLNQKYPPAILGTANQSIRDTFVQQRPDLVRHVEDEDRPTLNFEQPLVTVQVTMGGITMQHTLETHQRLDFVTVTDLEIRPVGPEQVTVNITDIQVRAA